VPGSRRLPLGSSRVKWRTQHGLEITLTALLAGAVAVALVRAAALAARLHALDDVGSSAFAARARDADAFVATTDLLVALLALALVPCFIVWCWRAAKNQQALGRTPERLSSGWAVGGWFVPVANLVIPVLVVQDLWRGSDERIARGDPRWRIADRSWLVGWWWGLFVVALLIGTGRAADQRRFDPGPVRDANLLALLGMLAAAASAVLAILVVHATDARQESNRLVQAASGMGAPR
jgi:hypothetical protein